MIEAAIGAGLAAFGLVVGYIVADRFHPNGRLVGQMMGLGAGVLMAVVAYALVLDTTESTDSPAIVGVGLAAGALVYFFGSAWLDKRSASTGSSDGEDGGGMPLALGAVLDGVPESMVIGISAALTGEVGIPLVIAAFIANIAESLAATPDLESSGMSRRSVLGIWMAILGASVGTAVIGYQVMSELATQCRRGFQWIRGRRGADGAFHLVDTGGIRESQADCRVDGRHRILPRFRPGAPRLGLHQASDRLRPVHQPSPHDLARIIR